MRYNPGNFLRRLALPQSVKQWSLTTLREKLVKIGAKVGGPTLPVQTYYLTNRRLISASRVGEDLMTASVMGALGQVRLGASFLGAALVCGLAGMVAGSGPAVAAAQSTQPATQPESSATPSGGAWRDWYDRSKNPVTWLKWGADLRLRWEYYNNAHTLNQDLPAHERDYYRQRARLWGTFLPFPNVEINTRLAWEFRAYVAPDAINSSTGRPYTHTSMDEALFDVLNVRFRNLLGGGSQGKDADQLDLTVGRQDICLGDGWLVGDGTPLDGSRTTFFDAVRATWASKPARTTVDLIYINQHADSDWLVEPFSATEYPLSEQDEQGAILYVSNKSISKTTLDGYFIYKHDEPADGRSSTAPWLKPLKRGEQGDVYTFGGRVERELVRRLFATGELAYQFGGKNGRTLSGLGFNGLLSYRYGDRRDNQFRLAYEYLSGDNPHTPGRNEGFDPLWGRYTRWNNDVYQPLTNMETDRSTYYQNYHRISPGWSCKPSAQTEFCLDYHLLFVAANSLAGMPAVNDTKNPASFTSGSFRGQLPSATFRYKINDNISTSVTGELFVPGNYYSDFRNDIAAFLQWNMVLSW